MFIGYRSSPSSMFIEQSSSMFVQYCSMPHKFKQAQLQFHVYNGVHQARSYDLLDWSTWRGTCKGVGQEPKIQNIVSLYIHSSSSDFKWLKIQNIFCHYIHSSSSDHKGLKHLVVSRVDLARHLVIPLWVTHWIIFLLRTFSIIKQINLKLNLQYFEIDLDSVFWYRKLNNLQHAYGLSFSLVLCFNSSGEDENGPYWLRVIQVSRESESEL